MRRLCSEPFCPVRVSSRARAAKALVQGVGRATSSRIRPHTVARAAGHRGADRSGVDTGLRLVRRQPGRPVSAPELLVWRPAAVRAAAGERLRRPVWPTARRAILFVAVIRRNRTLCRLLRAAMRRTAFPDAAAQQRHLGPALQRVLPRREDTGVQRQRDRSRGRAERYAICEPRQCVRLPREDRFGLYLQRQGLVRPR